MAKNENCIIGFFGDIEKSDCDYVSADRDEGFANKQEADIFIKKIAKIYLI